MKSRSLAITGMHRSGTSLVAQYLSECGLHIGDSLTSSTLKADGNYYGGHHEDKYFLDFHKNILRKKWIGAFPTLRFRLPITSISNQDREKALQIIQSRAELAQWGWKDPRTTLFLNVWDSIVEDVCFLLLIRKPLSVVDSLLRRGHEKHVNRNLVNGLRI